MLITDSCIHTQENNCHDVLMSWVYQTMRIIKVMCVEHRHIKHSVKVIPFKLFLENYIFP